MALTLLSIAVRHERRIQLVFSAPLAAGAFVASRYVIASTDGIGSPPPVSSALVVSGSANVVELALGGDLTAGARYAVTATAVPAVDTSTATGTEPFSLGGTQAKPQRNVDSKRSDAGDYQYGRDIVWTGSDYLETPDGDLAILGGVENAKQALERRLLANGLPWDPTYGAHAYNYVDGARQGATTLRGELVRQALLDDRVAAVNVAIDPNETDAGTVLFTVVTTLRGGETIDPVAVSVRSS